MRQRQRGGVLLDEHHVHINFKHRSTNPETRRKTAQKVILAEFSARCLLCSHIIKWRKLQCLRLQEVAIYFNKLNFLCFKLCQSI